MTRVLDNSLGHARMQINYNIECGAGRDLLFTKRIQINFRLVQ